MLTYKLTSSDEDFCVQIAQARLDANNATGRVYDGKADNLTSIQNEVASYCGEYAVAKLFGVAPDTTTHCRKSGVNDEGDLVINGLSVDVKTKTKFGCGPLTVEDYKQKAGIALYCLVYPVLPHYREYKVVGWMPAYLLFTPERQRTSWRGNTYYLAQPEELMSFEDAAAIARQHLLTPAPQTLSQQGR